MISASDAFRKCSLSGLGAQCEPRYRRPAPQRAVAASPAQVGRAPANGSRLFVRDDAEQKREIRRDKAALGKEDTVTRSHRLRTR